MKLLRNFLYFTLTMTLGAIGAGYLGFVHPLFDSVGHFRFHLLIISIMLQIAVFVVGSIRAKYLVIFLILCCSLDLYRLSRPYPADETLQGAPIRFLQFNLNFRNAHIDKLGSYLSEKEIDIVTLQEVTQKHRSYLETLAERYPYQSYCKFATVGGVAILSRYPFNGEGRCIEKQGLLWQRVMVNGKEISVASVHLYWPFPYGQPGQVGYLKEYFDAIRAPMIVAGDFNAASWSDSLAVIMRHTRTAIIPGLRFSLNLGIRHMMLPIDHILLSSELAARSIHVARSLGSDHLPIMSEIVYLDSNRTKGEKH